MAISVPRSYLATIAQERSGGAGDEKVDDAAVQTVFSTEKERITKLAAKVIGAKDESAVHVDWYYDLAAETTAGMEEAGMGLGVQAYNDVMGL